MINILLFSLLLLTTACIKTADQVQREKRFENMSEQMKDSQGLVADVLTQIKDMQAQLDRLNGKVEELEHRQKQVQPDQIHKMNETLSLLQTQQQTESSQLLQIQNDLKEQKGFLEKVTKSLSNMGQAGSPKTQKKSAKNSLSNALQLIKEDKFTQARDELEELLQHDELSPGDHNKVLHGLGRSEYYLKNYDKALVYFSKIYTKYPKASLAPSSLLFIARSLDRIGKKDEAKEAFAKVSEDYPGSKEALEAKKEL